MTEVRLVIVGSVEKAWPARNVPLVKGLIEQIIAGYLIDPEGTIIIGSGESPNGGVDIWVHEAADKMGLAFKPFPPTGRGWAFYKERDQAMADWCTHLVRIKSRFSTTYGSGWTRDQAAKQLKPTREYTL